MATANIGKNKTMDKNRVSVKIKSNAKEKPKRNWKRFFIYMGRWQLSSIVLWPCIAIIVEPLTAAIISNLVGGVIFYFVDGILIWRVDKDKPAKS